MTSQTLATRSWTATRQPDARVEAAVRKLPAQGIRTGDIYQAGTWKAGTSEMGDAVVAAL